MASPNTALPFSASIQFYGSGLKTPTIGPNTLSILGEEFSHDTVSMQFWGGDVNADSLVSGMPVSITYGRPTVKRTFYGYINHAQRLSNALSTVRSLTERNATMVTCFGASWPMKQQGNQSWYSISASQVAAQIAQMFGLAANITPHPTVWANLQMAGRSYWRFLSDLAKRIGYTFYCNGIQLVFKPRQTNPSKLGALVAIYDYANDPYSMPVFSPMVGATSPTGGQLRNRQVGGIDPRTSKLIYAQVSGSAAPSTLGVAADSPVFTEIEHVTIRSQDEANSRASGSGTSNQLYITATAQAAGNPLVAEGSLIFIQNANGSQNGLWFVTKARHYMDTRTYTMDLCLGRDSMGISKSVAVLPRIAIPPNAVLVNGTWKAR